MCAWASGGGLRVLEKCCFVLGPMLWPFVMRGSHCDGVEVSLTSCSLENARAHDERRAGQHADGRRGTEVPT
eukprot:4696264-Pyramimonas_sp.AAC.1